MGFIPVNEPLLDGNEKKYLCECIDTGWISSEGPFVKQFEEKMASRAGRRYGIAVTNGTAALEVAVQALDLHEGDEVIMPTFTIISCVEAVVRVGARPVLVDCDAQTFNMCAEDVEKKVTTKTKAIMAVHLYGLPVDIDPILEIADKYGLKVIEDAAEMHGQTYKGRPCGSFGNISIFSFYPNKHITTGEGGMVLTDDERLYERCRKIRNLCFEPDRRYLHHELSGNYRFTNLQAAVGLAQLERLDEFLEKKRHIGAYYTERLKDVKGIRLPIAKTEYAENIYWVYGIVLDDNVPMDNVEMQIRLKEKRIGSRTFFWCMHEQPVFKEMGLFENEMYPNAERLARRGLYIPSGLALTDEQMDIVADAVIDIMRELG